MNINNLWKRFSSFSFKYMAMLNHINSPEETSLITCFFKIKASFLNWQNMRTLLQNYFLNATCAFVQCKATSRDRCCKVLIQFHQWFRTFSDLLYVLKAEQRLKYVRNTVCLFKSMFHLDYSKIHNYQKMFSFNLMLRPWSWRSDRNSGVVLTLFTKS